MTQPRLQSALTVTSYDQFHQFVTAFGKGKIQLLLLIGDPGVAKSQSVRRAVKGEVCWIEGQASPFVMYTELYKHKDRPVVIDDVDALYGNDSARRLLKSLCQTDLEKEISWKTSNRTLDDENIPRSFVTRSRVCIICNEWRTLNTDVKAIEDRAIVVVFKPSPLEVHRQVAHWFKDQVAYDFIASILHLIHAPSMRHYIAASQLRAAGMKNWRQLTIERVCESELVQVAQIKVDPRYTTEKERIKAFIDAGYGSRATYFRYAKKVPAAVEVPVISLKGVSKSQGSPRVIPIGKAK